MTESIYTPPNHIILTQKDGKRIILPVLHTLFKETDKGMVVHYYENIFSIIESFDEIISMMSAPHLITNPSENDNYRYKEYLSFIEKHKDVISYTR